MGVFKIIVYEGIYELEWQNSINNRSHVGWAFSTMEIET